MNFKPLSEVANIVAGQSPASSTYNSTGKGLPFFQGKADFQDMYPKARMWSTSQKRKIAEPGDILVSVRAPVGAVNICDQKSIIGRGLSAIRPLPQLDRMFLYYFFKANEERIDALGTGSTFKAITQDTLKKIEIPIPPLNDQIRIATLLRKVEELIAKRKKHLLQLDDLLNSVFLDLFGDPVRNEKGWEKAPLSELCEFENGDRSSHYPSGDDILDSGVLFLSSREIVNFRLALSNSNYISEEKYESLRRGKCQVGDVLMVLRGAGLGKCCVFNGPHKKAFINAQMVILRSKGELISSFLVEQIRNKRVFSELLKVGSGSAQPQLTAAQVKSFKIVKPPIELQNQFEAILGKVEDVKHHYQQSLTDLESLYGALSQLAFKGDLDLSNVPLQDVQVNIEEVKPIEMVDLTEAEDIAIELPDPGYLLDALTDLTLRDRLLVNWLESYSQQIGKAEFSPDNFLDAVQTRVAELHMDKDFELGTGDYDTVKNWIFGALTAGKLSQSLDEENNRLFLTTGKSA